MKRLIVILMLLIPFAVQADFIARCDPPVTKKAVEAAKTTAAAVRRHLKNIDQIRADVPVSKRVLPMFGLEESTAIIGGHTRMCYQFFKPGSHYCDYSVPPSDTPFPAPAACAWTLLTAGEQAKVRALGVGP